MIAVRKIRRGIGNVELRRYRSLIRVTAKLSSMFMQPEFVVLICTSTLTNLKLTLR